MHISLTHPRQEAHVATAWVLVLPAHEVSTFVWLNVGTLSLPEMPKILIAGMLAKTLLPDIVVLTWRMARKPLSTHTFI